MRCLWRPESAVALSPEAQCHVGGMRETNREMKQLLSTALSRSSPEEGFPVFHFDEVGSTMDICHELYVDWLAQRPYRYRPILGHESRATESFQVAVFADAQSRGRGRQGRPWRSERGQGVYLSYAQTVTGEVSRFSPLPLAIGSALCTMCEGLGARTQVKWPNDIVVVGEGAKRRLVKVGGILVETLRAVGERLGIVIGVGINLDSGHGVRELGGVGLRELIRNPPSSLELAGWTLRVVERAVDRFTRDGFGPFLEDLGRQSVLREARVRVYPLPGGVGASGVEGWVLGISASGALRLQTGAGEVEVCSGELEIVDVRCA